MRKILISILLAGAAASPALAQDRGDGNGRWQREQSQSDDSQPREERRQAREERQQAREQARQERAAGGGNFERAQPNAAPQFEPRQQVQGEQRGGWDRSRFERRDAPPQQIVEQQGEPARRQSFERRGSWNRDDAPTRTEDPAVTQREGFGRDGGWTRRDGDLRQSDRPVPNVMRTRNPLIVSRTPREGTQPPLRADSYRRNTVQWSTNWRYNDRYDWRRWRDRHRSSFHIGVYYDPFGWDYRPYQIGWRLWPSYYSSRYWINDPWQYRLPYAPPGYVWVRYWDDAVLVDRWSGEVVDVIHNFFW
jgi:Sec-independent protein translocase protein TatA/Ni/Co efflux regulator RcnB